MNRIWLGSSLLLMGIGIAAGAAAPRPDPTLSSKAYALLKSRCFQCHGLEAKGGLDLRTRAAALKGGKRGPSFEPGKPAVSLLLRLVHGTAQPAMPLGSPLSKPEIQVLESWIAQGAAWPASATAESAPTVHWAFVPPRKPAIPKVKQAAWVRNPIDAFVLAELERNGLSPSPPANRQTLLRRVTLDLTGLPPTPDEIAAFVGDPSPDAYEKVVRRLLASPQYGVRWAQHWLDVVRFAETNGFELDADRPQAWRYRDYVVRALNEDRPYDRFLTEQLAGDLLDPQSFELRTATGFLRAGPAHVVGGNADPAVVRQEWLTETVGGVGSAVLGLTIGCARCHDHKFDPLPQADYYRLQAFFAATQNDDFQPATPEQKQAYAAAMAAHQARSKPMKEAISVIEAPYREQVRKRKILELEPAYREALELDPKQRTAAQSRMASEAARMVAPSWDEVVAVLSPADRDRRAALRKQMHALEFEEPEPLPMAPGASDTLSPAPKVHVLVRGDVHSLGQAVEPGVPGVLVAADQPVWTRPPVSPRLELARWLTAPGHPLTARVMVNRLWQHHFGRGLVATPNDFGKHGLPPSHPELLDWLANEFTSEHPTPNPEPRTPWSLKRMHYLMVTSSAYRQSSDARGQRPGKVVDPENRLLWRMNRQRLDAEALRDTILTASGALNRKMEGPSIRVPLEPEVYATIFTEGEPDNLWPVAPDPREHGRRSLYLLHKRNVRLPMLAVFDQPDMMTSCGARGQSVHALQALTLLNSDFMRDQSTALAARLAHESHGDETVMLRRLFLHTQGRAPTDAERASAQRFLREQTAIIKERLARGETIAVLPGEQTPLSPAAAAAWIDLCLAAFNLNDFAYVE